MSTQHMTLHRYYVSRLQYLLEDWHYTSTTRHVYSTSSSRTDITPVLRVTSTVPPPRGPTYYTGTTRRVHSASSRTDILHRYYASRTDITPVLRVTSTVPPRGLTYYTGTTCHVHSRDRPKPLFLVSAVAESGPKLEYSVTAVAETTAETDDW